MAKKPQQKSKRKPTGDQYVVYASDLRSILQSINARVKKHPKNPKKKSSGKKQNSPKPKKSNSSNAELSKQMADMKGVKL